MANVYNGDFIKCEREVTNQQDFDNFMQEISSLIRIQVKSQELAEKEKAAMSS